MTTRNELNNIRNRANEEFNSSRSEGSRESTGIRLGIQAPVTLAGVARNIQVVPSNDLSYLVLPKSMKVFALEANSSDAQFGLALRTIVSDFAEKMMELAELGSLPSTVEFADLNQYLRLPKWALPLLERSYVSGAHFVITQTNNADGFNEAQGSNIDW